MQSPLDIINKRYSSLRKSEKRVAQFVQEHTEDIVTLTLQGIAASCLTSDATVLRFCRSLGFLGFSDFKTALVIDLLHQGRKPGGHIKKNSSVETKKEAFLIAFQSQLETTLRNCNYNDIQRIAASAVKAKKIFLVGLGGSAGIAQILCDAFGSLGIFSTCINDPSIIRNLTPTLCKNDLFFGISHSGETEEVVKSAAIAQEKGAVTVGLTNFSPSPLADVSRYKLITSIPQGLAGVPNNFMGGYSGQARMAQLAVLEIMLYELSERLTQKRSQH
jgi:DNA-binding MurR/RpiR family transcriptional regulator